MSEGRAFYFGCVDEPGHYFWTPNGAELTRHYGYRDFEKDIPWEKIDGALTPKQSLQQGAAALRHKDGWTALAIHDYTVDRRPGSNSVFIFEGTHDYKETFVLCSRHFLDVFQRTIAFGIVLVEEDGEVAS